MEKSFNKIITIVFLIFIFNLFHLNSQTNFNPVVIKDDISVAMGPMGGMTMSDGGYLIYTFAADKKGTDYCHLSKYNINGKQLWYKRFNEFIPQSVTELTDGSIILCGPQIAKDDYLESYRNMYIIKLNSCGEVDWAKVDREEYHKEWNIFALRTMIDTGDGIVFPMRFDLNDPLTGEVILRTDILKIDYSGKVVFRKWIMYYGKNQEIWNGVVDSEGNILMNGSCVAPSPLEEEPNIGYMSPLIIKCDSEGNLLYIKNAKDKVIDVYGNDFSNKSLIDDDNNFFICTPDSFIPVEPKKYQLYNTIIEADNYDYITTHKFTNPDIQLADDRRSLYGFAFINSKQNFVTTMNYIHDDNLPTNKNKKRNSNILKSNDAQFINYQNKDLYSTSKENGDNDDYWKMVRNRLYVLDKEAKVIDSTDLEKYFDLGELVKYIFTSDNNEIILITVNRRFYLYSSRLHKFNSDLEPALIDNTPHEYDIYCDGQITSGLVNPEWEHLCSPDMIKEFNQEQPILRLSPNPAQNSVKLYLNFGYGEKQIEFYDTTGRLCKTISVTDGWAQETVDISDLKQGIYIVKLKSENNITATEKLIVK